jgi:hypothetical protein
MSIFPWDDWIYHDDYRRAEVLSLKSQVTNAANLISAEMQQLQGMLPTYQSLTQMNSAFAVAASVITMSDGQVVNLTRLLAELPDEPAPPGSTAEDIIDAFLLWPRFIKAVYRFGYLRSVNAFGSEAPRPAGSAGGAGEPAAEADAGAADEGSIAEITDGLGEASESAGVSADAAGTAADVSTSITADTIGESVGEAAAEAVIEAASLSTLAAVGIGIVIAVGVDFVFGLIDGAREEAELDAAIAKLQQAAAKLMFAQNDIGMRNSELVAGIVNEENRYRALVTALDHAVGAQNADPVAGLDATVENAQSFLSDGTTALSRFSGYVDFRYCWTNAHANDPAITREQFFSTYAALAPGGATEAVMNAYWAVLQGYSTSMAAAA